MHKASLVAKKKPYFLEYLYGTFLYSYWICAEINKMILTIRFSLFVIQNTDYFEMA